MSRLQAVLVSSLMLGCARPIASPTSSVLCRAGDPPPASWVEVDVPGTASRMWLPPTYRRSGDSWLGPDGEQVTVALGPHPVPDPRDPEQMGPLTGPICTVLRGDHRMGVSYWTEFPLEGGVFDAVSATWEETPGTDVVVKAVARASKRRREQLKIIHSLQPR